MLLIYLPTLKDNNCDNFSGFTECQKGLKNGSAPPPFTQLHAEIGKKFIIRSGAWQGEKVFAASLICIGPTHQ